MKRAGPVAMLAAPFARRLDRAVIALDRFDGADEQAWAERLFVPGLLRAGGLDTAGAMLAPRPLLVHNASRFDPKRIVRAYEAAGRPDAFRCEPGRMTVAALADWATGR